MKKFLIFIIIPLQLCCQNKDDHEIGRTVPPEVTVKEGYIKYLVPPSGFKCAIGWFNAIHDLNSDEESYVEIDYIRLYTSQNGKDVLLTSDEYDDGKAGGGLFTRNPWFGNNDNSSLPTEFNNGSLVLRTSTKPNNVWHIWNHKWPRMEVPENTERCWLEAKYRITGAAFVQMGIDFWKDGTAEYAGYSVNNTEAGASNWYYDSDKWQIIAFAKP